MHRRDSLRGLLFIPAGVWFASLAGGEELPKGSSRPGLESPWFPDRLHAFVWKNWESVSAERLAEVIGATPENVRQMGRSMGLPLHTAQFQDFMDRGYISLIRRNWHLLSYDQLMALLGWSAEKLAFTLKEDDFLSVKLGAKPNCPALAWSPPDETAIKRCAEIRKIVEKQFGAELNEPGEPRFEFVRELSASVKDGNTAAVSGKDRPIRFLYSYCAVYGDPLLHPELDPYPDGLLSRLAAQGVTGVWMHTVLRQLAPGTMFSRRIGAGGGNAPAEPENARGARCPSRHTHLLLHERAEGHA